MIKINNEFKSLVPPLTDEEFELLEKSIKEEGCRDAIVLWNNFIVDGHNRFDICNKHKIPYKTISKNFENENDICGWIIDNQLARRNLVPYDRTRLALKKKEYFREKAKEHQRAGGQHSIVGRQISDKPLDTKKELAKISGVSHDTIAKVEFIESVASDEIKEKLSRGEETINKAYKTLKKEEKEKQLDKERKQNAEEGKGLKLDERIDLRLGDFNKVLDNIPDNSIDCIVTDPPYPAEFLPLWDDLAEFSKKKLKENGYLICYSGQLHIPEVLEKLCKRLDYVWTFCLYHEGKTQIVNGVNVICRWKPVFIFQKGKTKFKKVIQDYVTSDKREKSGHDWQQGLSAVKRFIELFSDKDDLICDPFSGSGTTALACKELDRKFVGAELDETIYNASKKRLT